VNITDAEIGETRNLVISTIHGVSFRGHSIAGQFLNLSTMRRLNHKTLATSLLFKVIKIEESSLNSNFIDAEAIFQYTKQWTTCHFLLYEALYTESSVNPRMLCNNNKGKIIPVLN
jgi:hypothetical protein